MPNIFGILELGKRALQTQQAGLQTSQQNVANATTPGFHRQETIITTSPAITTGDLSSSGAQIRLGTGTQVQRIGRIRDAFLDSQIVEVKQSLRRLTKELDGLQQMEIFFNELSQNVSLNAIFSDFWNAWEALTQEPSNLALRTDVRQKGLGLAADIRHLYTQLEDLRPKVGEEIQIKVDKVNALLTQLGSINKDIIIVEAGTVEAGDLRDQRDFLIEQLADLINVKAFENRDGSATVLVGGRALVQGDHVLRLQVVTRRERGQTLVNLEIAPEGTPIQIKAGEIGGLLRSQDQIIPEFLFKLDELALTLRDEFNAQHRAGVGLDGSTDVNFFVPFVPQFPGEIARAAATLEVTPEIIGNLSKIAAGKSDSPGDNRNALDLVRLREKLVLQDNSLTFDAFYNLVVASLGSQIDETDRILNGTQAVLNQLQNRRESVSGVSLDEELINQIQFQRVFEAAARVASTVDNMVDTIINRMGLVGR